MFAATTPNTSTAFANVGNPQLTNAQGGFSFALLSVPLTTQYRVLVTDGAARTARSAHKEAQRRSTAGR